MKKLLLLALTIASAQVIGMDQNKQEPFPWKDLPLDMQRLIAGPAITRIKEIESQSNNITEAISQFKEFINQVSNFRLVSKDLLTKFGYSNLQQITTDFLNAVATKFPGQEIRIARTLNNQYAKEWLSIKKPGFSYKPTITHTYNPRVLSPLSELLSRVGMGDDSARQTLTKQLEKGLDPNSVFATTQFRALLGNDANLPLVKTLVSYGLDLQGRFFTFDFNQDKSVVDPNQSLLTHAQGAIRDYLEQEGAE